MLITLLNPIPASPTQTTDLKPILSNPCEAEACKWGIWSWPARIPLLCTSPSLPLPWQGTLYVTISSFTSFYPCLHLCCSWTVGNCSSWVILRHICIYVSKNVLYSAWADVGVQILLPTRYNCLGKWCCISCAACLPWGLLAYPHFPACQQDPYTVVFY